MKVVDPGIVLKYRKNKRNMQKLPVSQWNSNFMLCCGHLWLLYPCIHVCMDAYTNILSLPFHVFPIPLNTNLEKRPAIILFIKKTCQKE